jgi:hypothetical protein
VSETELLELKGLCPGAEEKTEGGLTYVYLPALRFSSEVKPAEQNALLCLGPRDGYPTRLFLTEQVAGKGANWNPHVVLGRTWWTYSWNNVSADQRPIQILAQHMAAFL